MWNKNSWFPGKLWRRYNLSLWYHQWLYFLICHMMDTGEVLVLHLWEFCPSPVIITPPAGQTSNPVFPSLTHLSWLSFLPVSKLHIHYSCCLDLSATFPVSFSNFCQKVHLFLNSHVDFGSFDVSLGLTMIEFYTSNHWTAFKCENKGESPDGLWRFL